MYEIEEKIENLIYEIRGKQVMLDSDLATLYKVETKRINEAVKNNPEKFPKRFSWVLDNYDLEILRSKFSTSSSHGGRRYSIRVFTEQGVAMIATIPIGYADGLRRMLSNKGCVVIRNKKAPIVGNICMDGIMVDVTDIKDVSINDDVFIRDNNVIKLDEIADLCGTINYEVMSTITCRVPRMFVEDKNESM